MRSMSAIVSQADAAARSDLHDPLTGESGTGKDVLADLLHSRVAAPQIP
jgi:transcriptional regulator with AAA-type ATPase domain